MRTMLFALLLVTAGMSAMPGVAAAPDEEQCLIDCDWKEQTVKDTVQRVEDQIGGLDPRDWPCTCDPGPLDRPIS